MVYVNTSNKSIVYSNRKLQTPKRGFSMPIERQQSSSGKLFSIKLAVDLIHPYTYGQIV